MKDEKTSPAVSLEEFNAYMPTHGYIFTPTREMWPAASVNSTLPPVDIGAAKPIKPSVWLDEHRAVHQMTWAPGLPMIITDKLVAMEGGSSARARTVSTSIGRQRSSTVTGV